MDLSSNDRLFSTNVSRSVSRLSDVRILRLDNNYLDTIPFDILQSVNDTLESVNLTLNTFVEVNARDIPIMANLRSLILDVCRIKSVDKVRMFE